MVNVEAFSKFCLWDGRAGWVYGVLDKMTGCPVTYPSQNPLTFAWPFFPWPQAIPLISAPLKFCDHWRWEIEKTQLLILKHYQLQNIKTFRIKVFTELCIITRKVDIVAIQSVVWFSLDPYSTDVPIKISMTFRRPFLKIRFSLKNPCIEIP